VTFLVRVHLELAVVSTCCNAFSHSTWIFWIAIRFWHALERAFRNPLVFIAIEDNFLMVFMSIVAIHWIISFFAFRFVLLPMLQGSLWRNHSFEFCDKVLFLAYNWFANAALVAIFQIIVFAFLVADKLYAFFSMLASIVSQAFVRWHTFDVIYV